MVRQIRLELMPHDRAILDHLAENSAAVGHLSRAYLDDRVRSLALDGTAATPETIGAGTYPMVVALRALAPGNVPGETARFMAYALSSRAQAVVTERYVRAR